MPDNRSPGRGADSEPPATAHVIDDDPTVCQSLSWLLATVRLDVRTFGSVTAYLASEPARPGCVLADVRLPGGSGLDLLGRTSDGPPPIPVILITGHADVPLAVRAMRSGAFDLFEKPVPHQALIDRTQEAVRLDRAGLAAWAERAAARARVGRLSDRERDVFALVVRGRANKQVAAHLRLSIKTVEAHRARVCEKLGCEHLGELVALAIAAGVDCSGGR